MSLAMPPGSRSLHCASPAGYTLQGGKRRAARHASGKETDLEMESAATLYSRGFQDAATVASSLSASSRITETTSLPTGSSAPERPALMAAAAPASVELYVVKEFLNEYTHKLCNWGRGAQTQHKATHAHTLVPTDNNTAGGSERGVGAKDWRAQETLPAHKHKTRKDGETGRRQPRSSEKGKSPQRTRQL